MTRVQDVITENFVRDSVEELVQEDLVYRQVFDQIDATGISSNAYEFQIAQDDMGRVQLVPQGAEVPRHHSTVDTVTVTFDKFAGEVTITMEAEADSLLDMKAREVEDLGRAMDETLNAEAFNTLNDNVSDEVGDANGDFSFRDIRDAIIAVRNNGYNPDTMVLDLHAYGDLLTNEKFNRATAAGDQVVATGEIGQIAGLNVVIDNAHDIGDTGTHDADETYDDTDHGHGAFLVDTNNFGYELQRTPMASRRYEDPERMADVVQVYTRRAWKALFNEAAVKING